MKRYFETDLEEIALQSESFLSSFWGKRVLVAGATGFVGSWLISLFDFVNRYTNQEFEVFAFARNIPHNFRVTFTNNITFLEGNVANFNFGNGFNPDYVFSAATPSVPGRGGEDVSQILTSSVDGTRNLLKHCAEETKSVFINLSSGTVSKRTADSVLDLSTPKDAYLFGKRKSEEFVLKSVQTGRIVGKNLRLYSFAGPGISLTDHFAVGNFLADAIANRPISIKGNPHTVRSYLYPTDLIVNILQQAASPVDFPIDLGSPTSITMRNLAKTINMVSGNTGIHERDDYGPPDEYVPGLTSIGVSQSVEIEESIARWLAWLKN